MRRFEFSPMLGLVSLSIAALAVTLGMSLVSLRADAAEGAWKEQTQVVWSKKTGTLMRKTFRVWDPHPELDLEFLWEPRDRVSVDDLAEVATGPGTLTWHAKGAPNYDRRFTYSVFKGVLKEGRPEGKGVLATRPGISYTGEWRAGLMHGRGLLRLENGDKYEGDFVAGKMHGLGRFVSVDGTVYLGEFRDGRRDGAGKLMLLEGSFRTEWRAGQEIDRQPIPEVVRPRPGARLRPAAASASIKVKLALDQKKASEIEFSDPDTQNQTYEADYSPGLMTIRPALWKAWMGDGAIPGGPGSEPKPLMDAWQFTPVFLKAEVENEGVAAAQIVGAYLDVAESTTNPAPYLELARGVNFCEGDDSYSPTLVLENFGWGPVKGARMTYAFGHDRNKTETATATWGDVDSAKRISVLERLRAMAVDVEKLRRAAAEEARRTLDMDRPRRNAFECEPQGGSNNQAEAENSEDAEKAYRACFERIKSSGVLGRLKDYVGLSDNVIYTTLSGKVEYQWTGSDRKIRTRAAPFEMFFPLIKFNVEMGEMGCPPSSQVPSAGAIALSLDRRKYRLALPKSWQTHIPQAETRTFELAVKAAKSSNHNFQLVLQLADGRQVTSPVVDLTYFTPRVLKTRQR